MIIQSVCRGPRSRGIAAKMAVGICLLLATSAVAQISPGTLSKPHSFLNGPTNCTACHRLDGQATFKCLECHIEIATRIAGGRGFHARIVAKDVGSQTCARCHSEHNGEQFPLTKWGLSQQKFEHGKTGWELAGKHATLSCNRCHTPANIVAAEKPLIKVKDVSRSYLGVARDCVGCHADPHRAQLGRRCEQCHATNDWKTVPSFDHSRTRFALTGGHARAACQRCHTPMESGGARQWTGLVFDRCTGCHTDPHRGAFVASCQSCHSTSHWKSVPAAILAGKFDHVRTKYPLLGKHALLRCEECHAAGNFKRPVAFQMCSDCHRPNEHSRQFRERAEAGECSACHTVEGFKPAKFGLREHNATAYPLEGKHASVGCERCHIPAGKATQYRLKSAQCTDCHRDVHEQQFVAAPILNRCESCHTVQGFRPSTFTLARHQTSPFPLSGSHVAVACKDCHKPPGGPGMQKVVRYRFADSSCTGCHSDPHRGQFCRLVMQVGKDGSVVGCQICHSPKSWKEMRFPHSVEGFPLVGKHRTTACIKCHQPTRPEITLKEVDFQSAPNKCEKCHQDLHLGQFARADGVTACADCHSPARWVPSLFDHNRRTRFLLPGKHRDLKCAACHKNVKFVQGKAVTVFQPTPRECPTCHRKPV